MRRSKAAVKFKAHGNIASRETGLWQTDLWCLGSRDVLAAEEHKGFCYLFDNRRPCSLCQWELDMLHFRDEELQISLCKGYDRPMICAFDTCIKPLPHLRSLMLPGATHLKVPVISQGHPYVGKNEINFL